jgi:hypothetical protein
MSIHLECEDLEFKINRLFLLSSSIDTIACANKPVNIHSLIVICWYEPIGMPY